MDHLDLFTNLLLIIPKWTALIVVIYPKNNYFYWFGNVLGSGNSNERTKLTIYPSYSKMMKIIKHLGVCKKFNAERQQVKKRTSAYLFHVLFSNSFTPPISLSPLFLTWKWKCGKFLPFWRNGETSGKVYREGKVAS